MNKEEKYQHLSTILLKRLIVLEKNLIDLQNELEGSSKNYIIKVYIEAGDIIPFTEIIKLLNADDKIFEIFNNMINCEYQNLDREIKQFFSLYIT